jgi:hypothetical protein
MSLGTDRQKEPDRFGSRVDGTRATVGVVTVIEPKAVVPTQLDLDFSNRAEFQPIAKGETAVVEKAGTGSDSNDESVGFKYFEEETGSDISVAPSPLDTSQCGQPAVRDAKPVLK